MKKPNILFMVLLLALIMGFPVNGFAKNACNSLVVDTGYMTIENFICTHGKLLVQNTNMLQLENKGLYGPDCLIFMLYDMDGEEKRFTYNVQQDYCALEAGDITTKHISGETLDVKIVTGSLKDNRGGEVDFSFKN